MTKCGCFPLSQIRKKPLFRDAKTIPSVSYDSDHRIIVAKLITGKPKTRHKRKQKRFKLENLKDVEHKQTLKDRIEQQRPRIKLIGCRGTMESYEECGL